MKITTQVSEDDFVSLMQSLYFRKPISIMAMGFMVIFTGFGVYNFINMDKTGDKISFIPAFALLLFYVLYLPYKNRKVWRKAFRSNNRRQEEIVWEFNGNMLTATGTSFGGDRDLNKSHKIEETDKWFLLYESNGTFNMLPKKAMDTAQESAIRDIFRNLDPAVTRKLK